MASNGDEAGRGAYIAERRNDQLCRSLRVTQKELPVIGANRIQTRIEVFDISGEVKEYNPLLIFSVKHTHSNIWGRQMVIHKNLQLACMLAEVQSPITIPPDSIKMFEKTENIGHMHTYMERIIPHVRYSKVPQGVSLYWWRAAGCGAAVLQNNLNGRLLIALNKDKTIPAAVSALTRTISQIQNIPENFTTPDPDFPTSVDAEKLGPDVELTPETLQETVQAWALAQEISPWLTKLTVKVQGSRKSQITNYRYSVGVDSQDVSMMCIQVHSNEPLSRELKAFPVCMVPMASPSSNLHDVNLTFQQACWFLQKLFDFHVETEAAASPPTPKAAPVGNKSTPLVGRSSRHVSASSPAKPSPTSSQRRLSGSSQKPLISHVGQLSGRNSQTTPRREPIAARSALVKQSSPASAAHVPSSHRRRSVPPVTKDCLKNPSLNSTMTARMAASDINPAAPAALSSVENLATSRPRPLSSASVEVPPAFSLSTPRPEGPGGAFRRRTVGMSHRGAITRRGDGGFLS